MLFLCAIFDISSIGSIVPISLFANIILINIVSFLIEFFSVSKLIIPSLSTSIYVISYPCFSKFSQVFSIAGCSILEVIICFPLFLFAFAIPFSAVLSLSDPQLVKYISFGFAPITFATFSLASSIALLFCLPMLYSDDGFP